MKVWRRRLVAAGSASALAVSGLAVFGSVPMAQAATTDGTVTVLVSRDFSGDGRYDAGVDLPQSGVEVSVSDASGNTVSGLTDANGEFYVDTTPLAGGRYMVEVQVPPALSHLQIAPAGGSGDPNDYRSATTFVDVNGGVNHTVRVGVWNPANYTALNPDYALAIQPSISDPAARSLVRSNWVHRGNGNGAANVRNTQNLTTIATQDQTGSIFGVAWSRTTNRVFSAAYAKAFIGYGPDDDAGAIYVTDPESGTPNAAKYVSIPNAGSTAHDNFDSTNHDDPFFAAAGQESLGGITLSEDDSTLYVVNLFDKRLYEVDVTGPTGSILGSTPIADPGCVGGVWRPGAVGVRDGEVYVGGICDASVSQDRADLHLHVMRLNGTGFDPVFDQALDFTRGQAENGGTNVSRQWNPWRNTWSRAGVDGIDALTPDGSGVNVKYPTPLLLTLEFDSDGSMFFGFRDRFSDQIGAGGLEPATTTNVRLASISAGDINKACINPGGTYSWEGTGSCPDNAADPTYPDGGQPAGVTEFFDGDWVSLSGNPTNGTHMEIAQGGLTVALRQGELATNAMDPTGLVGSGGVGFFNTTTGQGPGGAPNTRAWLVTNYPESFGKGNGLGDLDVLGGAPVQIGNRVWFDADRDGLQDPDELPLPGVTVSLVDELGAVVATTVTNAAGEYYFGGDGAAYQLVPGGVYTVRFDASTADISGIPGLTPDMPLSYTTVGAGGDREVDSNPTPTSDPKIAEVIITAPVTPGSVDHSIDAGVIVPLMVSVGDFVWLDQDADGVQDPGEPGIPGVVLTLTGPGGAPVTDVYGSPVGPATTGPSGEYTFENLPALPPGQHYTVHVDNSQPALTPYQPTVTGGGARDVDSSTSSAESRDLTADGDRDDTLDFGFVVRPPAPQTGGDQQPQLAQPVLTTTTSKAKALVGVALRDKVTIRGFVPGGTSQGQATLYGPFSSRAAMTCTNRYAVGTVTFSPKNGTVLTPAIKVTAPGYYTWVASISADDRNLAATHRCGVASETSLIHRRVNPVREISTGYDGIDPSAARQSASLPVRVELPSIGVKAPVVASTVRRGKAIVPASAATLGWLRTSARLGDAIGTTVIAGHVSDQRDQPGALFRLKELKKGQVVTVVSSTGERLRYRVSGQQTFDRERSLPTRLFTMTGAPRLLLVSCTDKVTYPNGRFHYRKNLVVTLVPVS